MHELHKHAAAALLAGIIAHDMKPHVTNILVEASVRTISLKMTAVSVIP